MTLLERPPIGFQPRLTVDDPVAAFWLSRATLRLRREIAWLWHERGGGEGGRAGLPPTVDALSDALDHVRWESERTAFFEIDETANWLTTQISRPEPATQPPHRGSFGWVADALSLAEIDRFALALAVGGVIDSARGPVIAACLDDTTAIQPNVMLVQRLWEEPAAAIGLLDPAHPLAAYGLLDPAPTNALAPLEVAAVVARQLLYPKGPPPAALVPVAPPTDATAERRLDVAVARLRTRAADRVSLVPVIGPAGSPRTQVSARIAAALAMPLLQVSAVAADALRQLVVVAWLRGAALHVPFRALRADEEWWRQIARLPVVVFVGADEADPVGQLPEQLTQAAVRLTPEGYEGRLDHWRRELPALWSDDEGRAALTECARRFRYEGDSISRVAAAVRALERPPDRRELFEACRADLDLGDLAQPVTPRFDLDELMLPPRQTEQIRQLVVAAGALATVHHDWGTARAWNESGLSVLFAGPPGTGKTMAAEAIARALDMPMYRIDLSQVVNKYIGETEKNLRRLFDAADAADVILFFDEADALFGKRTEVKDAHDRYANLEVSYLLERMERFRGMAVLATNRKKDLDDAFMRRLRFVVQFPLPGPQERLRIWRGVLPPGVDHEALELEFLAERIPLSGGHIRSAVFNACLQSVRPGEPPRLEMAAVVRAVKDEFDKLGRAVSLDQFGPHAEHIQQ